MKVTHGELKLNRGCCLCSGIFTLKAIAGSMQNQQRTDGYLIAIPMTMISKQSKHVESFVLNRRFFG